jgi:hypothetical protein
MVVCYGPSFMTWAVPLFFGAEPHTPRGAPSSLSLRWQQWCRSSCKRGWPPQSWAAACERRVKGAASSPPHGGSSDTEALCRFGLTPTRSMRFPWPTQVRFGAARLPWRHGGVGSYNAASDAAMGPAHILLDGSSQHSESWADWANGEKTLHPQGKTCAS